MVSRHIKIWKWLLVLAPGLLFLKAFAPLSGLLDMILSVVALAILLVFSVTGFWEERRERQANQPDSAAIASRDQM